MASLNDGISRKILQQVEFYFSDSNLPRDDFLKKSVARSPDGLVSLALICSFSRMRNYLALGTRKREEIPDNILKAVAESLRKSSFLKVSEDGKKVGRAAKLAEFDEVIEQVDSRTIAASPFEYNVKIEHLQTFFAQYGKVNSVRLPHHVADKRCFCGTALIEFSTEEEITGVLQKNLFYAGTELELKLKKEFDIDRANVISNVEKSSSPGSLSSKKHSSKRSSYTRGLVLTFKVKKSSVKGREQKDIVSCENLKSLFQRFGDVKRVDYRMEADSGYVCYEQPESAIKAHSAAQFLEDFGLTLKDSIASIEVVTGGKEARYWDSVLNNETVIVSPENESCRQRENKLKRKKHRKSKTKRHRPEDVNSAGQQGRESQKVEAS